MAPQRTAKTCAQQCIDNHHRGTPGHRPVSKVCVCKQRPDQQHPVGDRVIHRTTPRQRCPVATRPCRHVHPRVVQMACDHVAVATIVSPATQHIRDGTNHAALVAITQEFERNIGNAAASVLHQHDTGDMQFFDRDAIYLTRLRPCESHHGVSVYPSTLFASRGGTRDNDGVRITVNNTDREKLFDTEVSLTTPPSVVKGSTGTHQDEVALSWDGALDDAGQLCGCPVCGCRELFCRKDFPQVVGISMVVAVAVTVFVMFIFRYVVAGFVVLAAMAVIDFAAYLCTGRCLVCYRCRSEFRGMPIRRDHPKWDLSIGEKYRQHDESRSRMA